MIIGMNVHFVMVQGLVEIGISVVAASVRIVITRRNTRAVWVVAHFWKKEWVVF